MKNNNIVDINTYKLQKQLNEVVQKKFDAEQFEVDYEKQLNKSFIPIDGNFWDYIKKDGES